MKELVDERLGNNTLFSTYESSFNETDAGELMVYLNHPLYSEDIAQLEHTILEQGVTLTAPIRQDGNILLIKFRKELAPLLIIGGALAAIVAGISGWQIFKMTQSGIPLWAILGGGAALLYLLLSSKPAKQAGGLAIQAGKVYVTRKMLK